MKKLMFRILVLLVLTVATFFVGDTTTKARMPSCGGEMFTSMYGCDSALGASVSDHFNVQNTPNTCHSQAATACYGDPNPSSCESTQYAACMSAVASSYNNRYNTYGNCLSTILGAQTEPCTHAPDYCPEAYSRRDICDYDYVNNHNDFSAWQMCIDAIPNKSMCLGFN
jgi:hypothetical protein